MATSPPLHGTASDLIDYCHKAGLINDAHGSKKRATDKWRLAVTDLYGSSGCLRAFEPHGTKKRDRAWSLLKDNILKLLIGLNKAYIAKSASPNMSPLEIEAKGHRMYNEWESSSKLYNRELQQQRLDKENIVTQCDAANRAQGLVHGPVPILSPPGIDRTSEQQNTPSQSGQSFASSGSIENGALPMPPLPDINSTVANGGRANINPRVPSNRSTSTMDHFFATRNTGNMEDDNDVITVAGPLTASARRPAMQQGNPRPQTRPRTGGNPMQRPLAINSLLSFPEGNGVEPIRPAHTITEDQRARNIIETYDNGQDISRAIYNSLQDLRRNNPLAQQIRPFANFTPAPETPYVAQAQAWKDLTSGFGGAQNIADEDTRKKTMDVYASIMANIGNAAKNNEGNGNANNTNSANGGR